MISNNQFNLCLWCRVLATLRFHQFITIQSVKYDALKLSIELLKQYCHIIMGHFPIISSSPHIIPSRLLPWDNVQSRAIGIFHVELTQHNNKQFIGVLNSNMGNSIDHYFGTGLRQERRWWSWAVPWYPQDTFLSATISPISLQFSPYHPLPPSSLQQCQN